MNNRRNYTNLPYNPNLKKRAGELHKANNLCEALLWNRLKQKQFKNYDFDRQKVIENYIVDFFCLNCGVAIEIGGSTHDLKYEYDKERDAYLECFGLKVIHIQAKSVLQNLSDVREMLDNNPDLQ